MTSALPEICRALLVAGASAEMIVAAVEAEHAVDEQKIIARRARDTERKRLSRAASAMSRGQSVDTLPFSSLPHTPSYYYPTRWWWRCDRGRQLDLETSGRTR